MRVLLRQFDGKMPNIALMRIAAFHRYMRDDVEFRFGRNVEPEMWDAHDLVYASLIFTRTRPDAERLLKNRPDAIIGGTGWDETLTVEDVLPPNIPGERDEWPQDYSIYPRFRQSIDFSQRGCRLKCSFCVVPRKEGAVTERKTINEIWRGDPWPREIILLDNDFFGQPHWRDRIDEMRNGRFKVSFNQGINARMLTDETAAAIASVDYRDDGMKDRRIYTAWDNRGDERRLFEGLNALVRHGVKPRHIMVYMLIGYWPNETAADRDYRRAKLRDFGALPYPMPYTRTRELIGFQRWVIQGYDKAIPWQEWERANYDPRHLLRNRPTTEPAMNLAEQSTGE